MMPGPSAPPTPFATQLLRLVLAVSVPFALFSLILAGWTARIRGDEVLGGMSGTVRALQLAVDGELRATVTALQALALSPEAGIALRADPASPEGRLARASFQARAREVVRTHPAALISFNLVRPDGTPRVSTGRALDDPLPHLSSIRGPTGAPRSDAMERWAEVLAHQGVTAIGVFHGSVVGRDVVALGIAVRSGDDVLGGILASLPLADVTTLLGSLEPPAGWAAAIVDHNGLIVARIPDGERLVGQPAPSEILAFARSGARQELVRTTRADGERVHAAVRRLDTAPWLVVMSVPEALVTAPVWGSMALAAAGGVLAMAVAIVAALVIGRRLRRDLEGLAVAAGRFGAAADAGWSSTVPVATTEVAIARDAFARAAVVLRESEARLRAVVEFAPFPIMVHADDGTVVLLNRAWLALTGHGDGAVATVPDWVGQAHGEPTGATTSGIRRPDAGDGAFAEREIELRAADGRTLVWMVRTAPLSVDASGRRLAVSIAADVTERRRTEARLHLLMREVDHRAKNALQVVQAVVQLSRAEDPADYAAAVIGRIQAIAGAHGLLAESGWSGSSLHALVTGGIAPFSADRHRVEGPLVVIHPEATQAVSMIVHELTTNAAKYGALSTLGGSVAVTWRIAEGAVHLSWVERGGPAVTAPTREGFGTTLLRSLVVQQLNGTLRVDWRPEGLCCALCLPSSAWQPDGIADAPRASAPGSPGHGPDDGCAGGGRRILVVEDEALTALAFEQELAGAGFEVVGPVGRVEDALDMIRAGPLAAAVLDVNLFGEPVTAVADALATGAVPFLFCTGYQDSAVSTGRHGRAPVLQKPVKGSELTKALDGLIRTGPVVERAE